jgi:hypothetical protein
MEDPRRDAEAREEGVCRSINVSEWHARALARMKKPPGGHAI